MSAEHTAGFGKKTMSARDLSAGEPQTANDSERVAVLLRILDWSQPTATSELAKADAVEAATDARIASGGNSRPTESAEPARERTFPHPASLDIEPAKSHMPSTTAAASLAQGELARDSLARRDRHSERGSRRSSRSRRDREASGNGEATAADVNEALAAAKPRGIHYQDQPGVWQRWSKTSLAIAGLTALFAIIYFTIAGNRSREPDLTAMPRDLSAEMPPSSRSSRPPGFEIYPELPPVQDTPTPSPANHPVANAVAETPVEESPAENTNVATAEPATEVSLADGYAPGDSSDPHGALTDSAQVPASSAAIHRYPVTDPATFDFSPTYHLSFRVPPATAPGVEQESAVPAATPNFDTGPADGYPTLTEPGQASPVSIPSRSSAWQDDSSGNGQPPNTARLQPRIEAPPLR